MQGSSICSHMYLEYMQGCFFSGQTLFFLGQWIKLGKTPFFQIKLEKNWKTNFHEIK